MASVSLRQALGQAACRSFDGEDVLFDDLDAVTAQMTKALLESAALSEVEQRLGRAVYERRDLAVGSGHAADYRNGYRSRRVQTAWTTLRVRLPRLRLSGYVPSFLVRRHRAVASPARIELVAAPAGVGDATARDAASGEIGRPVPDLGEVRGQAEARRGLEIALAGGHGLLLVGPPGSGKTLLARTIPGLLPPLDDQAALAATVVASAAGEFVSKQRPSASAHSLRWPQPLEFATLPVLPRRAWQSDQARAWQPAHYKLLSTCPAIQSNTHDVHSLAA